MRGLMLVQAEKGQKEGEVAIEEYEVLILVWVLDIVRTPLVLLPLLHQNLFQVVLQLLIQRGRE